MSSEYTPRPGTTREHRTVRREVVVPDGPWDGLPVVVTPWTSDGPLRPVPRPNRAARRAAARNAKRGHRA